MVALRERRRQQAAEEIAGVAHTLFLDRGYDRVSVDDIAAAAGCSPRTVYRYFGSKEGVLFYDLPPMLELLIRFLDDSLDQGVDPWRAVTEAMAVLFEQLAVEHLRIARDRMHLWLAEPGLRARYMEFIAKTEDAVIASLRNARYATAADVELAPLRAVAAVGAYRATLMVHHSDSEDIELVRHLRQACAAIGAGLGDRQVASPTRDRGVNS